MPPDEKEAGASRPWGRRKLCCSQRPWLKLGLIRFPEVKSSQVNKVRLVAEVVISILPSSLADLSRDLFDSILTTVLPQKPQKPQVSIPIVWLLPLQQRSSRLFFSAESSNHQYQIPRD